jgi:hypothetical protein
MKSFAILSSIALALAPFVAAHGYVDNVRINGKTYKGPDPGARSAPNSVIRPVSNVNPSYGHTNPNINCGPNSRPAGQSAPITPGGTIEIDWHEFTDGRKWPHDTGPLITYMANCGGDCKNFDSNQAQWFKIDESGKGNGGWPGQKALFQGKSVSVQIPSNLAKGNYLLMHHILSLHLAGSTGTEFYSSCIQLEVGGNQSGAPSANELRGYTSLYTSADDHPGGVYGGNYAMPGPNVSRLATKSNNVTPPTNEEPSKENPSKPTPSAPVNPAEPETPEPTPSQSTGGSCKKSSKKEASTAQGNNSTTTYKPRRVSRVMRAVAHDIVGSHH